MEVKFISQEEAIPLRIKILRNGKLEPTAIHSEDTMEETFHLGYFENGILLGIASYHPVSHKDYSQKGFQLRGMAVEFDQRNKNIGRKLNEKAEEFLKTKNIEYIWCNARESAFPFYEKMKYKFISEMFDVPQIGPHKVMIKFLND